MKNKAIQNAVSFGLLLLTASVSAQAATSVSINGKVTGLEETSYQALLVSSAGAILKSTTLRSNGKFKLSGIAKSRLRNSSLHLTSDGSYVGPIVLRANSSTANIFFSGKLPTDSSAIPLGKIDLETGYAAVRRVSQSKVVNKALAATASSGAPIGAGKLGFVSAVATTTGTAGQDDDSDGIINIFDVDTDGDLLANSFDLESPAVSSVPTIKEGENEDKPFTTLYLDMNDSLNVNIGSVTIDDIDEAIEGGSLAIVYFFGVQDITLTGAHVVCNSALPYCRSSADGGSTSTVSGVSESVTPPSGQWSAFNDDASGYPNLDLIEAFQGGTDNVFVASVNPGVGTADLVPGDVATLEFMENSSVRERRPISLPSYFVTVPAMSAYDIGSGTQTVSYSSPPGTGSGDPLIVPTGQTITLTFWRPQRLTLGEESGEFRDISGLHYGLIVSTQTQEFGCDASRYSSLTSLSADGDQTLWPLLDTATADLEPDAANVMRFTLDLRACLQDNSAALNESYQVSLTAAGAQETGGNNRAAQLLYMKVIP